MVDRCARLRRRVLWAGAQAIDDYELEVASDVAGYLPGCPTEAAHTVGDLHRIIAALATRRLTRSATRATNAGHVLESVVATVCTWDLAIGSTGRAYPVE